jgi:peroxiredoxin
MLELGSKMPHFELKNVMNDKMYASTSLFNKKPSLIMVICNHCPYVIHYHEELKKMSNDFKDSIDFVAISSNDIIHYPQDGPKQMKQLFKDLGLSFPYLFDETQNVARALKAECTPEFYLYDNSEKLVYRGRMDNSSPGNDIEISGNDLREACSNLLNGSTISLDQHPSMGCNIKWK